MVLPHPDSCLLFQLPEQLLIVKESSDLVFKPFAPLSKVFDRLGLLLKHRLSFLVKRVSDLSQVWFILKVGRLVAMSP